MLPSTRWLLLAMAIVAGTAVPAWADPVRNWISDSYRQDRKSLNQHENFQEDRLRDRQDATLDRQRDAWQAARRNASPQVRAQLDREYNANRKALQRRFDNQRDGMRSYYDNSRDAMNYDYRQSLRNYEFDRRNSSRYYVPLGAPRLPYGEPREEIFGIPGGGIDF